MILKKYKLLTEDAVPLTYKHRGIEDTTRVFPIEAIVDIPSKGVRKGDKGGYVESEDNLSHEGNCWIYPTCAVINGAVVLGNASISKETKMTGDSQVSGDSSVENSMLFDSMVDGNTKVSNSKLINSVIYEEGNIHESTLFNVTIWRANFFNSKIQFKDSKACFTSKETSDFTDTFLEYTGLRSVNTNHPMFLSDITIRNLKTFKLESGLEMRNVVSIGTSHIISKKNDGDKLNRLMGKKQFVLQSKARVTLKDSQVQAEGYLISGKTLFEDVNIDTFGEIKKNGKSNLHLKNVTMTEFSSLVVEHGGEILIENINLCGDIVFER